MRPIGCFIPIGYFPQKSPIIRGSFAKRDLLRNISNASSSLCTLTMSFNLHCQYLHVCTHNYRADFKLLSSAPWAHCQFSHVRAIFSDGLPGVLQCVAVCRSVSQCVAVCRSVSQCVAVCCSVSQCGAVFRDGLPDMSQCFAVRCSVCVLQCVAVCCSPWRSTRYFVGSNRLVPRIRHPD